MVGMNDYLLDYALQGGESFETPQAIMVNGTSIDEVTLDMHKFTMNHINRTYFSYEWVCEAKSTNGGDWTDPFRFFGTTANSGKSVDDYWNALKTYHANNWSKLAK